MKVIDVDVLNGKLERLAIQRIKGDDGCDVLTVSLADVLRMIDSLSTIELEATFADRMSRKLDALGLPVREYNCLRRYGIDTIADLYKVKQDGMLPKVRNLGKRSAERIEKVLDEFIGVKPELGTNLAEVGTDCISRQDALFALGTITMYKGSIPYDTAVMRIKQLPPIQPDNNSETPNSSDTISRQQAIDDILTVSPLARLDRKWVDRWLRQLPSAQPTFDARDTQYNLPIGTDLISRQAAIDAIQAHKHNVLDAREYDEGVACGYAAAHNHICDVIAILPSAQPEIVRCKDCKYAEYIDDVKTLWCTECGQGRTVAPYDFCSYAEKKEVTT